VAGAAAEAVVVHSKSFRYRLRRVKELAGLDFDDPQDRLLTHLQLRSLRQLRN
jgi:sugar diacid utilization regulator